MASVSVTPSTPVSRRKKRSPVYDSFFTITEDTVQCCVCQKELSVKAHPTNGLHSHRRFCKDTADAKRACRLITILVVDDGISFHQLEGANMRSLVGLAFKDITHSVEHRAVQKDILAQYQLYITDIREYAKQRAFSIHIDELKDKGRRFASIILKDLTTENDESYLNLGVKRIYGTNTAIEMKSVISSTLLQYGVPEEKVVVLVGDGAPINNAIARELGVPFVRCFAHALNLVVRGTFYKNRPLPHFEGDDEVEITENEADDIAEIRLIRKLMKLIKSSTIYTDLFIQFQRQADKVPLQAVTDNATRWTSLYCMLERYVERKEELISTLDSIGETELSQELQEFTTSAYIDFLKIMKKCTEVLSESRLTLPRALGVLKVVKDAINTTDGTLKERLDFQFYRYISTGCLENGVVVNGSINGDQIHARLTQIQQQNITEAESSEWSIERELQLFEATYSHLKVTNLCGLTAEQLAGRVAPVTVCNERKFSVVTWLRNVKRNRLNDSLIEAITALRREKGYIVPGQ